MILQTRTRFLYQWDSLNSLRGSQRDQRGQTVNSSCKHSARTKREKNKKLLENLLIIKRSDVQMCPEKIGTQPCRAT